MERRAPAQGLGQEELHVAERALDEAALAVGEVVLPQAQEAARRSPSARASCLRARKRSRQCAQRARVVRAEVLQVRERASRCARATRSVSAATEGMKLPGNTWRWMKSTERSAALVALVARS